MASTKIQNLPIKSPIGSMKIPTGGFGDYSITVNGFAEFIIDAFNIATTNYVDNIVVDKEDRILTTGGNLSPVSQLTDVPDTNNDVIDEVAQALLDRIEYVKDNFSTAPSHNELLGRSATGAHPSTSIAHKSGTVYTYLETNENDINQIKNITIPNINQDILEKQDLIETGGALTATAALSPVPSVSHVGLNTALQALVNRDKFINDKIKTGLPPVFDSNFSTEIGGYPLNARVMLNNGDIVKSTVPNNTGNPNNDLTGWVKINNTSQITDSDGNSINIKPIPDFNPSLTYADQSVVIKDGMLQKYTNGVWRPKAATYYDFGAKIDGVTDDTAAFIAYHAVFKKARLPKGRMLLSSIDLDQFKNGQSVGIIIEGDGTEQSYFDFTGTLGFYSSSNTFFRDFKLSNLKLNRKAGDKVGIGVYIGSAGAEQVNFKSVSYSGWLIGRATHTWNSSFKTEVFRSCKYPFTHYGTSSNIENPYALNCSSPYMFGYASDINGNITVPSIPFAYSELSGFAADDCGADGAIYKFGRCSGITINSPSCERVKGLHVFDLYDLVGSAMTSVVVNNFSMYIPVAENQNLTTLIKKPNALFGAAIFNDLRVSTDKEIALVSDDGSGVILNNVKTNDKAFTRITQVNSKIMLDGVSWGGDTSFSGEVGVVVGANNISYTRVKNKKGKVLIDPTTQKLCIYGGALSEGLAQGLMLVANITVNPLNKGGNNANEKAGIILMSSAMDFNASNMGGHLKTVLTGTLTTLTTVTRNTENTTHLQFDVVIEATSATTRYLLDIDLTYNGISNPNRITWEVVSK